MVKESKLEAHFCREVRALRGRAVKLTDLPGFPDRLVIWPDGTCEFVEMKQPKGRLAKHQKLAHEILTDMQHKVVTLWNAEQIAQFVESRKHYATKKPTP